MKKFIISLLFSITIFSISAQTQGIAYQAILIDQNAKEIPGVDVEGNYLPNQPITIRFSILNNNGTIDYQEEHQTVTDKFGMINLIIGTGTVTSSSPVTFRNMDWNGTPKNLRVEISIGEIPGEFTEFSLEKLLFVPYAFHKNITATDSMIISGKSYLNNQVTINANVDGADNLYGSYPLRVEGSTQGIAIKIDGTRSNANNFISFIDSDGTQGRVEGQTASELHNSFDYIWDQSYQGLMDVFAAAIITADLVGLDDADAAAVEGVELVASIADWAKRLIQMENNVGVAFESGGADYAEWLKKADNTESFSYGDIVGVKGGQISKHLKNADHYMVVSKNPVILGNMPPKGNENNYEKIAFLGQVSVKVRGAVQIGDYIIASGSNDGFGRAARPENMTADDCSKVVGVAWSDSDGKGFYSMINVAIGLNNNMLTTRLKQQADELQSVKAQLNQIIAYLKSKDPSFKADLLETNQEQTGATQLKNTDQKNSITIKNAVAKIIEEKPELLEKIFSDTREMLDKKGIDYNKYEQTKKLVSDPEYFLQMLDEF